MHSVEHLPWHLAATDSVEIWQILTPPSVGKRRRVDHQVALLRNGGHFCGDPTAPVDDGPEDIEGEHPEIGKNAGGHRPTLIPEPPVSRSDRLRLPGVAGCRATARRAGQVRHRSRARLPAAS